MKTANTDITAGDFVYLNPSEGKNKSKLGGHELGPFAVFDRTARTFVIQRGDLVERVNGDRITKEPTPPPNATGDDRRVTAEADLTTQDATPEDMQEKEFKGKSWPVSKLSKHRVRPDGKIDFFVGWEGSYAPTWEPRTHIPEELVSRYLRKQRSSDRSRAPDTGVEGANAQ